MFLSNIFFCPRFFNVSGEEWYNSKMRYWQATLKDGSIVVEPSDLEQSRELWRSIESRVIALGLFCDNWSIHLPSGCKQYLQGKGASVSLNGNDWEIESRWISCILGDGKRLLFRLHEGSQKVITEIL
jgi:hypothetical protein